jgi:DNA-binding MarR family transcriptional regulator
MTEMKEILEKINRIFENKVRLGIMSALMVSESLDFKELKEILNLTDGNLSSNAAVLETEGYIRIEKKFVGKKTQTIYRATGAGKIAFTEHLNALEEMIRNIK